MGIMQEPYNKWWWWFVVAGMFISLLLCLCSIIMTIKGEYTFRVELDESFDRMTQAQAENERLEIEYKYRINLLTQNCTTIGQAEEKARIYNNALLINRSLPDTPPYEVTR